MVAPRASKGIVSVRHGCILFAAAQYFYGAASVAQYASHKEEGLT
ncbi:hypothetical protein KIPE111705_07115 [Kibdelosporangium persicum]